MFENKKTKIIVIIVIVIIAALVIAFSMIENTTRRGNIEENGGAEEQVEESIIEFGNSYLYRAGENGEQSFRDAATEVTEFNVGDFLAVNGSYTSEESGVVVQLHIFDSEDNIVQENALEFRANEGEDKSFDACCEEVPSNPGSYYIGAEVETEGERKSVDFSLPFDIIESGE